MFKYFASAILATVVSAQSLGANGYSRGVPPTTQNCNSYPSILSGTSVGSGDFNAQDQAWGLVVDREFGGCRCADEDEMEFQPDADSYMDNTWACRCLNQDLYLNKPEGKYVCVDASYAAVVASTAVAESARTDDTDA